MASSHEENTFELLHLLLVCIALKIFVSIRMKYTSYKHKFSNITNFPYNKRFVVILTIFRYAREFYEFVKGTGAGRLIGYNTLAPTERH